MSTRVQHALEQLKNNGVRITPQRHAILCYLLESMGHPTADEIYRSLEPRFPNMSVATVYNNLKMFIEAGLVRELTYGDNSSRFDADVRTIIILFVKNAVKLKISITLHLKRWRRRLQRLLVLLYMDIV